MNKEVIELSQDVWSLTRPTFGEHDQLEVIGWSGQKKSGGKYYILKCSICARDSELFKDGKFRSLKSNLLNGQIPCGCSIRTNWSKGQYSVLCSRKAEELGYKFLGFEGEWKGNNTRIKMLCEKHGEWATGRIVSLIQVDAGCFKCMADTIKEVKTKPDEVMVASFLASECFHPDTKFWRSERKDSQGMHCYWHYYCPECGKEGESPSDNLQRGCRSCECSMQRQKSSYINLILDRGQVIALKFGIAINIGRRVRQQDTNCIYSVVNYSSYIFESVGLCKQAERECKQKLLCGVLTKEEMPNGYTETTYTYNLEKIVEIYERNGGILNDNQK